MRIAYFVNHYPKVSHSFIRREILALESLGLHVSRYALRGWAEPLADAEDIAERDRTKYVLRGGVAALVPATLTCLLTSPVRWIRALKLALTMSRRSDRPWPFHLVYLAEACRLARWLEQQPVAHVHAHFGTNSAEIVALAHILGGPDFSFTVHGPEEFDKPEALHLPRKMAIARFVVAISSFGRSQLWRWLPHHEWHKVKVVRCGINKAFHSIAPQAVPDTNRLVCVGRLCEQKGQMLLIEATRRLRERGMELDLVLAGDGEMRPEIERLVAQYGLEDCVRITGWISGEQVRAELLEARALVLPSFAEGLPVVIMEAMALRRPILSTYVAGIPELVHPDRHGWLFPAGDVDALVHAMTECLRTSPEQLQIMGDAGRERVLQRHDADTEAAKLASLISHSSICDPSSSTA
jgi:colanic acid/amylovoran biosynthesis glycosyltransferase